MKHVFYCIHLCLSFLAIVAMSVTATGCACNDSVEITNSVKELQDSVADLKAILSAQKKNVSDLKRQVSNLKESISDLKREIKKMNERLENVRRLAEEKKSEDERSSTPKTKTELKTKDGEQSPSPSIWPPNSQNSETISSVPEEWISATLLESQIAPALPNSVSLEPELVNTVGERLSDNRRLKVLLVLPEFLAESEEMSLLSGGDFPEAYNEMTVSGMRVSPDGASRTEYRKWFFFEFTEELRKHYKVEELFLPRGRTIEDYQSVVNKKKCDIAFQVGLDLKRIRLTSYEDVNGKISYVSDADPKCGLMLYYAELLTKISILQNGHSVYGGRILQNCFAPGEKRFHVNSAGNKFCPATSGVIGKSYFVFRLPASRYAACFFVQQIVSELKKLKSNAPKRVTPEKPRITTFPSQLNREQSTKKEETKQENSTKQEEEETETE